MAAITSNPIIDLVSEQQPSIYYLDDGAAIFACIGSPNNVIIANARSLAIDESGNLYIKTTNGVSSGWVLNSSGAGTTINPTNLVLPVRSSATAFADSSLTQTTSTLLTSASEISPSADNTFDIGSSAQRWRVIRASSVVAHNDAVNSTKVTLGFSGSSARVFTDALTQLQLAIGATVGVTLDTLGNLALGGAAIATTATDGFLHIVSTAGTPTGTASSYAGRVPIVIDTTNSKLYGYISGAWINLTGNLGTVTGTGTTGNFAKFTGTGSIGNSLFSESSNTITSAGSVFIQPTGTTVVPLRVQAPTSLSVEGFQFLDSSGNRRVVISNSGTFAWVGFSAGAPSTSLSTDVKVYFDQNGGAINNQLMMSRASAAYEIVARVLTTATANTLQKIDSNFALTNSLLTDNGSQVSLIKSLTGDGLMIVQNSSTTGYSSININDSSGVLRGGYGYGNSGVAAPHTSAFYIANANSSDIKIITNNTTRVTIPNGGNVRIDTSLGINVTPTQPFDIRDTSVASGMVRIQNNSNTGYSNINCYSDASVQKVGFGFGNSGSAAPFASTGYIGTVDTTDFILVFNSLEKLRLGTSALTFIDAHNIAVGTGTGTKIATATSQKLGFWNATPVIQPAGANQAAITDSTGGTAGFTLVDVTTTGLADPVKVNNDFASLARLVDNIRTALVNAGIMKGAA